MSFLTVFSFVVLLALSIPVLYLYVLAAGSMLPRRQVPSRDDPGHRFAIAIPAHDEAAVIAKTVVRLKQLDYPSSQYQIHVVADHCADGTARLARDAGAQVHERNHGPRTGKGAALRWLFSRILSSDEYDAVVIIDADTRLDADFLSVMNGRLAQGHQVVQGNHVIRNPRDGWFPLLTWAMFLIDNRFQNLGRSNLGCSAKHMGDSICFRADILRRMPWGQGLTEDYQFRQQLLLQGITVIYEPRAIGYGEAPPSRLGAQPQRRRWLSGVNNANRDLAAKLLAEGIKDLDLGKLDAACQAYFPSYSTLTLISLSLLTGQVAVNLGMGPMIAWEVVGGWLLLAFLLAIYPILGLALERAPALAYLAILSGPLFIIWRTGLALSVRLGHAPPGWVRTQHGERLEHR